MATSKPQAQRDTAHPTRRAVLRVVVVVLLAVAIWTFAESRSLATVTRTATVVLASPASSPLTAYFAGTATRRATVTLRLEGSRAALDRAANRLADPIELVVGQSLPAREGRTPLALREALREHEALARLAVTLVEASPALLEVRVDQIAERTVPVRLEAPGVRLASAARISPPSVRVSGPATVVRAPGVVGQGSLLARVPASTLAELAASGAGSTATVGPLALSLPPAWSGELVRVEPPTVTAELELGDTIETVTLASVPVAVRLSPSQLERWTVRIAPEDAYLRDVRVEGPGRTIAAIADGRLPVVAFLALERAELAEGSATFTAVVRPDPEAAAPAAPVLDLPLTGLRIEVADRTVPVEILPADQ